MRAAAPPRARERPPRPPFGGLGVAATLLFFMWVVGRLVVTAPILNSTLNDELRGPGGYGNERTAPQASHLEPLAGLLRVAEARLPAGWFTRVKKP